MKKSSFDPSQPEDIFVVLLEKFSMNFKMYVNSSLVENILLDKVHVELPGYIQGLCHLLEEKHEIIINQSKKEPEFFIDGLESGVNLELHLLN